MGGGSFPSRKARRLHQAPAAPQITPAWRREEARPPRWQTLRRSPGDRGRGRRDGPLPAAGRCARRQADLHHPAHQRHALQPDRPGPVVGLHAHVTIGDDQTRGGYARLAALGSPRARTARQEQGPMLVLDAGDYSMGTPFGAASRELGAELRLMARMGYDATTFGNHEFDLGPDGLGAAIDVAAKAGRIPVGASPPTSTSRAGDPMLARLRTPGRAAAWSVGTRDRARGLRFGLSGCCGAEACLLHRRRSSPRLEAARAHGAAPPETEKVDVVIALEPRRRGEGEGRALTTATTCAGPGRAGHRVVTEGTASPAQGGRSWPMAGRRVRPKERLGRAGLAGRQGAVSSASPPTGARRHRPRLARSTRPGTR